MSRRFFAWIARSEPSPPHGVLALVTAILFAEILVGGRILYERDIHLWFYGQAETLVRCVAAGSWPVWDPYLAFGQPLLGNPGAQVLYPWTWLNFLVQPARYYSLYVVSHHLLSAFGFWRLARRLDISPQGALIAATLWAASGPLLSFVNLWQHFAGASWIPWVLVAADRALSQPRVGRVLAWGAAVAMQILAGSVEMAAVTAALSALVLLRHLAAPSAPAARGRRLAATLAAAGVALGLSAALWLPALDVLSSTRRLDLEASSRTFWSLHPASLTQALWPLVLKDLPLTQPVKLLLFDGREPYLGSVYLGLCAFPLVAAALAARGRVAMALAAALFLGVALALGRHTPLYELAVTVAPVLRVFRYPIKLMIVPALAWALLAGQGFDRWASLTASQRRLVVGLGGAATAAALAGAVVLLAAPESAAVRLLDGDAALLRPVGLMLLAAGVLSATLLVLRTAGRLPAAVALVLLALDLLIAHRGLNATMPRDVLEARPATLDAIEAIGPTRLYAFTYVARAAGPTKLRRPPIRDAFTAAAAPPLAASARAAVGLQMYLAYSAASRWGLYSGYWADSLALGSQKLHNLDLFLLATEETPGFLRMLRIAAVSHVMAMHTEGLEELRPVATFDSPFRRPIRVFRVPDPLPRAYVVGGARVADGFPAYQTLVDPGFEPASEIVVPEAASLWDAARALEPSSGSGFAGGVRALAYAPDRVRAAVTMSRHGYFVLADAWAPGWRASVDGAEAPVLRANVAFRAVPVPAGEHEVELVYRPPAIRNGLILSAATIAACLLALAFAARAGTRRPEEET